MHADKREEIDEAAAGDIVAVLGVDCASGDTYAAERKYCTLESMFVPEPVIRMAISPLDRDGADRLGKALHRFRREDPTFRVSTDEETGETIIAGMGELHLEIYVERIRREYGVEVEVGAAEGQLPRGAHAGGRVQLQAQEADRRLGPVRPHRRPARSRCPRTPKRRSCSRTNVVGGRIPKRVHSRRSKRASASRSHKGPVAGIPIVGVKAILEDGSYHEVDSSDMAFQICAADCFRETFPQDQAGAAGAGDEDRDRVPDAVPGPGGGRI